MTSERVPLVNSLRGVGLDVAASFLRRIKNYISGHEIRKADCIRSGLLQSLSRIFNRAQVDTKHQPEVKEEIWIEASHLIAVIASQGPAFVQPILHGDILPLLLNRLSCTDSIRQHSSVLRSLNAVADNLPVHEHGSWTTHTRLSDLLFSSTHIHNLDAIVTCIASTQDTIPAQQLCCLSICLLCKICLTERHKRMLFERGLLKVLASRLASFIVAEGLAIPSLESLDFPANATDTMPEPFPTCARLSPVLELTSLMVENSKSRAEALLSDSSLSTVLSDRREDQFPSGVRQASWTTAVGTTRLPAPNAFDALLPHVPAKEKLNSASNLNFPPLGAGLAAPRRRPSFHPISQVSSNSLLHQPEVEPQDRIFVSFLTHLVRRSRGRRRMLACRLLVALLRLDLIAPAKLKSFASLLVPLAVSMLQDVGDPSPAEDIVNEDLCTGLHYTKLAPAILASLILDDSDMQKVAVESKAIPKLANALRQTFEMPTARSAILWRSQRPVSPTARTRYLDCTVGPGGPSQALRQNMTYREGTLQALAAIAPFNDAYRKAICDQGILQQIMSSLEPFQFVQVDPPHNDESFSLNGNSAPTILAACATVRALTRSVTALRTKLVDANVAKAVIRLMTIPDPEVRIAATKVLSNLAMDFSPMKESIGEIAVVKKLCEQAHSASARLRLESLWALKQLVANAPRKLKQEIVNELGPSWMKLLIKTDPYDIPAGEVIGLVDKEYPPPSAMEAIMYARAATEDVVMSEDGESDGDEETSFADANSELSLEAAFRKHTPEEDLAIQEQLLDLIRNLFCGENASDLVEYLLKEMDKDEFFKIMLTRLRHRMQPGPTRKDAQMTPPPTSIVTKVLYIIVNIAASAQKWRLHIAQDAVLLKHIATYASDEDPEVRAQCCWVAINLLFEDESTDRGSCRRRAMELQKAGFAACTRRLENDQDLNVRERAKTASHLFAKWLDAK